MKSVAFNAHGRAYFITRLFVRPRRPMLLDYASDCHKQVGRLEIPLTLLLVLVTLNICWALCFEYLATSEARFCRTYIGTFYSHPFASHVSGLQSNSMASTWRLSLSLLFGVIITVAVKPQSCEASSRPNQALTSSSVLPANFTVQEPAKALYKVQLISLSSRYGLLAFLTGRSHSVADGMHKAIAALAPTRITASQPSDYVCACSTSTGTLARSSLLK